MGKKVAIVGSGPAGVVAAIALKRQGYEPTLYDKIDPIEVLKETLVTGEQAVIQFGDVGGAVSLYGNGLRALKNIGLLEEVETLRKVGSRKVVFSLQDGSDPIERKLAFKPGEPDNMFVSRAELHEVLMKHAHSLGIKTLVGKKFKEYTETADGVSVTFHDGTVVKADFLIGADGVYSGVRRALFPDAPMPTVYGSGYIGTVDLNTEKNGIIAKFDTSMQTYMDPIGGHSFYHCSYSENGCAFVVLDWNKPEGVENGDDNWKPFLNMPKETAKLATLVDEWGMKKECGDAVRIAKRLAPVSLVDLPDLDALYKGRVVLIGDAAHGTLPTYGQGLNLAFEDGTTLGDLFGHFKDDKDSVEKVFAIYNKVRKPHVNKCSEFSRGIAARLRANNQIQMRIGRFIMRMIFTIQNGFDLNDEVYFHDYRKPLVEEVPGITFK